MLELKEKQNKLSGADKASLKKIRKTSRIRAASFVEDGGAWKIDWRKRGVAARIVHLESGLTASCESFSSFNQNRMAAETEMEKVVELWVRALEEEKNQTVDQASPRSASCPGVPGGTHEHTTKN